MSDADLACRHELAATAAGTLRVDAHADIAATDLEFDEQGVIVRSIDGSERARFAVDRLSWRRA